jgi:hypothetical protein
MPQNGRETNPSLALVFCVSCLKYIRSWPEIFYLLSKALVSCFELQNFLPCVPTVGETPSSVLESQHLVNK